MKNTTQWLVRLASGMVLLLLASGAFAQQDSVKRQQDSIKTLPPVTVYRTSNVNQKVTQAFDRNFKDAVGQRWYQLNKDYMVEFIRNDMQNKALFQKDGYLLYHIRYGFEQNLPSDVRRLVRSTYGGDYKVTRAVNVLQDNRDVWMLNLEGQRKLILIHVEKGEIKEVGNYNKSI
jgi:hypothetical protein